MSGPGLEGTSGPVSPAGRRLALKTVPGADGATAGVTPHQREGCLSRKSTATRDRTAMEIATHDRTHQVTEEERAYAEKKLAAVVHGVRAVARADIEFDRDLKKRPDPMYVVKVTLHLIGHRLPDLRGSETGRHLRAVVDLLMDKIDGELHAYREVRLRHPARRRRPL